MADLDDMHHVTIQVASIERSLKWYLNSFRCEVVRESSLSATLRFGNIQLTLVLPSQEPAHLAFVRDDAHTLGTLRRRPDGYYSTFIADPTGNPVEILAPEGYSAAHAAEAPDPPESI